VVRNLLEDCMASSLTQAREGSSDLPDVAGASRRVFERAKPVLEKNFIASMRHVGSTRKNKLAQAKALVKHGMNHQQPAGAGRGLAAGRCFYWPRFVCPLVVVKIWFGTPLHSRVLQDDG